MFDDVPARVWLLIMIAVIAFAPAKYVYLHIAHAPSRRDITQPPKALHWRRSGLLVRSLAMLALLAGLAVFIFTPTAEALPRSPLFWPILMASLGAWAILTVAYGLGSGRIELLVRGFDEPFERDAHPKRYWASLAFNAALGCATLWFAYRLNEEAIIYIANTLRFSYKLRGKELMQCPFFPTPSFTTKPKPSSI